MEFHFFMTDEATWNNSVNIIKHSDMSQGVGYLDDRMVNYFLTPKSVIDHRAGRIYIRETPYILQGDLRLVYDNDRVDTAIFGAATTDVLGRFFNIIEDLVYSQSVSDSALDTIFESDLNTYGGYVVGSLQRSVSYTTANIKVNAEDPASFNVRNYVKFKMRFIANGPEVDITIWVGSASFLNGYPYTTIIRVIPPCEPSKMLDPTAFTNVMDAISKSSRYIDEQLKLEDRDYTDVFILSIGYNSSTYVTRYEFPFCVIYKGKSPDTTTVRSAIRNYLLELEDDEGSTLAPEDTWKNLFPELFVLAQFFVIPEWSSTVIANQMTRYRSSSKYATMLAHAQGILSWMGASFVTANMEILMSKAGTFHMAIVPGTDNEGITSIITVHPTYMAIDPLDPAFNVISENTKDFILKLNSVLAKLQGATNSYNFTMSVFDDRNYLTFMSGNTEYHVLKPESY